MVSYFHLQRTLRYSALAVLILFVSGCTTARKKALPPTPIMKASVETPEEELLDVGITVFDVGNIQPQVAEKLGTSEDIRRAESHYMPYHLKQVLQGSAHWGAVRVVPDGFENVDLLVQSRLFDSNGQEMHVVFLVTDATGKVWMEKEYDVEISGLDYARAQRMDEDPFQPIYHQFANDLAAFKQRLSSDILKTIRITSRMRFAVDLSPDPYAEYLERQGSRHMLVRLPAEDDPMMKRLMGVRDSEALYIDTLDKLYEVFYLKMDEAYLNWRKFNETELEALHELKRSSFMRIAGGIALVAAAIALELGDVSNTATLRQVMVLAGGAVIVDGVNISKQKSIHQAGVTELGESFSADLESVVIDFHDKQIELTGTIEEQFQQWRGMLRQMYRDETGFPVEADPQPAAASGSSSS